jgi:NADPH2:quinone reductase
MKAQAIRIAATGGPEELKLAEVDVATPSAGEVLIRHEAIGVNFIDVYHRIGLYKQPLPLTPGSEGVGIVESVGAGVTAVKPGDRVGYGNGPPGAYATHRLIPADRLVPIPAGITSSVAASVILKGLTAEYLVRRIRPVKPGDVVVVHAAAGGTGSLATQWARHLGATVIGLVGSEAKVARAKAQGCHHVFLSTGDFAAQIRDVTGGRGADIVYDSVGKDTFDRSLDALATRGWIVLFGQSSGIVPPFDISRLAKGSYTLTRPSLFHYHADPKDLQAGAAALFDLIRTDVLKVDPPRTFALKDAAEAHRALEGRQTTGALVLLP